MSRLLGYWDVKWLVLAPLSIWLGATGRVDWWIIVLVWLSDFSLKVRKR